MNVFCLHARVRTSGLSPPLWAEARIVAPCWLSSQGKPALSRLGRAPTWPRWTFCSTTFHSTSRLLSLAVAPFDGLGRRFRLPRGNWLARFALASTVLGFARLFGGASCHHTSVCRLSVAHLFAAGLSVAHLFAASLCPSSRSLIPGEAGQRVTSRPVADRALRVGCCGLRFDRSATPHSAQMLSGRCRHRGAIP